MPAFALVLALAACQEPSPAPGGPSLRFHEDFNDPTHQASWPVIRNRPLFPLYNAETVEWSRERESRDERSRAGVLYMTSLGGNVGVETRPGLLGGNWGRNPPSGDELLVVSPSFAYRLRAHVLLEQSNRNYVQAYLRWTSRHNELLEEHRSPRISDAREWRPVILDVFDVPAEAAYVQVGLVMEGPDVRAACRWDDIELVAIPQVRIHPEDRALGIFDPGETATFRMILPDQAWVTLSVETHGEDLEGATFPVERAPDPDRPGEFLLTAAPRSPGFYEIVAEPRAGGARLAQDYREPFVVLPPHRAPGASDPAMGLSLNPYTTTYGELDRLLGAVGCGRVKVTVWDRLRGEGEAKLPEVVLQEIQAFVLRITEQRLDLRGVLSDPPRRLFSTAEVGALERNPAAVFLLPRDDWRFTVQKVLQLVGEQISRWQVGADGDERVAAEPDLARAVSNLREVMRPIQPHTKLGVPLPGFTPPPAGVDFASSAVADRALLAGAPAGAEVYLSLPSLDAARPLESQRERGAWLARALTELRAQAFSGEVTLSAAALTTDGVLDRQGKPTAALLTLRLLANLLSGASLVRDIEVFPPELGIRSFAFDRGTSGVIVAWHDGPDRVRWPAYFGPQAVALDPFGREIPMDENQEVEIGSEPVIFAGADLYLLRTILSMRFEPEDLDLVRAMTPRSFRMENHFPAPIEELVLRFGDLGWGWTLGPRELRYDESVAPGAPVPEKAVRIQPPITAEAGVREVPIQVYFRSGGRVYRFPVYRPLTLVPILVPEFVLTQVEDDVVTIDLFVRNADPSARAHRGVRVVLLLPLADQPPQEYLLDEVRFDESARVTTLRLPYAEVRGRGLSARVSEAGSTRAFGAKTFQVP